jgi:hypothetical protein
MHYKITIEIEEEQGDVVYKNEVESVEVLEMCIPNMVDAISAYEEKAKDYAEEQAIESQLNNEAQND